MSTNKPVLIYQMGKVGSVSIYVALKNLGIDVHHLHYLVPRIANYRPTNWYTITQNIYQAVLKKENGWRIICPIREPVARAISAVFEKYSPAPYSDVCPLELNYSKKREYTTNFLDFTQSLDADLNFYHPEYWFKNHLYKYFEIDVFSEPFNPNSGWKIYQNDIAEVLIIRLENLQSIGCKVISNFLNIDSNSFRITENRQSSQRHPETYYKVKKYILQRYIDEINLVYQSMYSQHFYSKEEIDCFLKQWHTYITDK